MEMYDQLLTIWERAIDAEWANSETELREKEWNLTRALLVVFLVLIISLLGLCVSIALKETIAVMVSTVLILAGFIVMFYMRLAWDRPLQRDIDAFRKKHNRNIFETITKEYGIGSDAWKLVLDSARLDQEEWRSKRNHTIQTVLTVFIAIYVSVAASSLWHGAQQFPSASMEHSILYAYLGALVVFTCAVMRMTGDFYEKFFIPRKWIKLGDFIRFIEEGLYHRQIACNMPPD